MSVALCIFGRALATFMPAHASRITLIHAYRSRLGCQVIAAKELDGLRVRIPSATRNFAVDG